MLAIPRLPKFMNEHDYGCVQTVGTELHTKLVQRDELRYVHRHVHRHVHKHVQSNAHREAPLKGMA